MINVQEKFVIWWELFYISSTLFVITTYVYVVLSINDKKNFRSCVCVLTVFENPITGKCARKTNEHMK